MLVSFTGCVSQGSPEKQNQQVQEKVYYKVLAHTIMGDKKSQNLSFVLRKESGTFWRPKSQRADGVDPPSPGRKV